MMKHINPQSMTELAKAAFRQAARKVIERAIRTNTSIIVRDPGSSKIMHVDPREMAQQLFPDSFDDVVMATDTINQNNSR